jgi:NAD(P)-dependent dehydrogenase (short-subunit alcohol dehydrogenase family)
MAEDTIRIFSDAVAIVTGAASGIGRALAKELAERGAHVVVADVQDEAARAVVEEIRTRGCDATAAHLDVTDFAAVSALVDKTRAAHRRLDYMFNNAGIGAGAEILEHSLDTWNRIVDVNLRGVIHGVHAVYPMMAAQGYGHIVNTASMQGLMPGPFLASYSTTKHAVVGLSKALRAEARAKGVRVSVLCPGVIRTPLLSGGVHGIFLGAVPEGTQRQWMKSRFELMRPMDATTFARKTLDRVARNRAIIIVPSWWKAFWWLERMSPALSLWLAAKGFEALGRDMDATLRRPHAPADATSARQRTAP